MFLIIGIFILFCTTATLWLVFVPKLLELKKNPLGTGDSKVRATLKPMSTIRPHSTANSVSSLYESKLREIKINNSHYRKLLTEKETELQNLLQYFANDDDVKRILENRNKNVKNQFMVAPALHLEIPSNNTVTSANTSSCSLNSTIFNNSDKKIEAVRSVPTPLLNLEKIEVKRSTGGQVFYFRKYTGCSHFKCKYFQG